MKSRQLCPLFLFISLLLVSKFSQGINPDWIKDYNFSHSTVNVVVEVGSDANGNIYSLVDYVAFNGKFAWRKLDPAGTLISEAFFDGYIFYDLYYNSKTMFVDNLGNSVIAYMGLTDNRAHIKKVDASGNQIWDYIENNNGSTSVVLEIKADDNGNVYACGYQNIGANSTPVVIKLLSDGTQGFFAAYQYGTSYDANEFWEGVSYDPSGNVFVTGRGYKNANESYNFITAKYNSSGVFQWINEQNGNNSSTEEAGENVVADGNGGCYSIGSAFGVVGGLNGRAVKVSSTGATSWVYEIKGNAGGADYGVNIALLSSGDPVITGDILSSTASYNAFTARLDASTGIASWTRQYDNLNQSNDVWYLDIDLADNVGIGGASTSGSNIALTVVKYDNAGTMKFAKIYNSGDQNRIWDLKFDGSGNILTCAEESNFAIGESSGIIIQYDPLGNQSWVNKYQGPGNGGEYVQKIISDSIGNTYLACFLQNSPSSSGSLTTIKLDKNGNIIWKADYSDQEIYAGGMDIILDYAGNVIVGATSVGASGTDYFIAKYSNNGNQLWYHSFDQAGHNDYLSTLAIDKQNNIYATGYGYQSANGNNNEFIMKLNSAGTVKWVREYNYGNDIGGFIKVDSSSNVYVTFWNAAAVAAGVTLKYTSNGALKWAKVLNGDNGLSAASYCLAITSDENVVITGMTYSNTSATYDAVVVKYDQSNGSQLWKRKVGNKNGSYDEGFYIATDENGNSYVTGLTEFANDSIFTFKVNSSGVLQWTRAYAQPNNFNSYGDEIAVDTAGNVYVVGLTGYHLAILKYNSNGNLKWSYTEENSLSAYDAFVWAHLTIDGKGGVYAGVAKENDVTSWDLRTIKICDIEKPIVTTGGPTTFCEPGSVALSTSGTDFYQWSNGETNSSINVAQSGSYKVTGINSNGCNATSTSTIVTVNPLPDISISALGEITFCSGGSVTLSATGSDISSYQWKKNSIDIAGATTSSYIAKKAGTYSCSASNSCGSVSSNDIQVTLLQTPVANITPSGTLNICSGDTAHLSANIGSNLSYQWKKGNINIVGATNSTYSTGIAGSYRVIVTNTVNSCSKTSNPTQIVITCRRDENEAEATVSIFPNPTHNLVYLQVNDTEELPCEVFITDVLGRVLVSNYQKDREGVYDLSGFTSGIYFIRVLRGNQLHIRQIELIR